jgi:para-nitrobenzyl esterase
MSDTWSTFARTAKAGAKGQLEWVGYDTKRRATMLIYAECKLLDNPFTLERDLLQNLEP